MYKTNLQKKIVGPVQSLHEHTLKASSAYKEHADMAQLKKPYEETNCWK